MKTQEEFEADYSVQAEILIKHYNECKGQDKAIIPEIAASVKRYANVSNGVAVVNTNKLDQLVNDSLTNDEYATHETIGEIWKNGLYEPHYYEHKEKLAPSQRLSKRLSKADKLKVDIAEFERLEQEKETIPFNLAYDELDKLKESKPFAYHVYKALTKEELAELNYKEAAIKTALIEKSNQTAEGKLKQLLPLNFKVNMRYTKSEIKHNLQRLYNTVVLKDKHGNIKVATAEQLGDNGRFELQECKKKEGNTWEPAFLITRTQFELKVAA